MCRMCGDNSWASVEGRYYRAVLGVSEPIYEVGLHSPLNKYLGRETFAHPHTLFYIGGVYSEQLLLCNK